MREVRGNRSISGKVLDLAGKKKDFNPFQPNIGEFFDNQDEWLTSAEAAGYLKITEATLRNMVCYGKITCYKLGRCNRYLKSDLRSLLTKKIGGF